MGFYEAFKKIRNQIRKLDPLDLINSTTKLLHQEEMKPITENKGLFPWRLLLIIRWGFEYGGEKYPSAKVTPQRLIKIISLIHDFEGAEENPFLADGNISGLQKFLRTLSFQQFWSQKRIYYWDISRQIVFFCELPSNNEIKLTLTDTLNDIDLSRFLELMWCVFSWLSTHPNIRIFKPDTLFKDTTYSSDEVNNFCEAISLRFNEVREYLKERPQRIENPYFQLIEKSPFILYPLLKVNDHYLVYSKKLFQESISCMFYDLMKLKGGSHLAELFSKIFEGYVHKCLEALNINFFTEKELMHQFPGDKVTDFLIPFNQFNLIIELKAIELNPIGQVNPNNKILQNELEDSICKGVIQGFSIINSMKETKDTLKLQTRDTFFLMIVTYRNLYFGPSDFVWDEFLKEAVEPYLIENNLSEDFLPPENIIFLSIDEFDLFISVVWQEKTTVEKILQEVKESYRSMETRKHTFSQHLEKYMTNDMRHPLYDEICNKFMSNIRMRFN